jgi:hypothetical protein
VFFENKPMIQRYTNEVAILNQATSREMSHIIHLEQLFLGIDHAAFSMKKFEMSFREYLHKHRNVRELRQILR